MRAQDAIEDDLQYFDVDDQEPGIYEEVKHRYQRVTEHLLLAECQQQEVFPSPAGKVIQVLVAPQQDVFPYLSCLPGKKIYCRPKEDNK